MQRGDLERLIDVLAAVFLTHGLDRIRSHTPEQEVHGVREDCVFFSESVALGFEFSLGWLFHSNISGLHSRIDAKRSFRVTTMWSRTIMPMTFPARTRSSVIARSSELGVGSPLG